MRLAVIGDSTIHAGFAIAADCALAGHDVRIAAWPGEEGSLAPVARRGGIELTGRVDQALAGDGGLARVELCELAEVVQGAELIVIDTPAPTFEARFETLAPHLADGQIVHVAMHGYWPALRFAPILARFAKQRVTVTEGSAPTHAAACEDAVVDLQWVRRGVPVAAFPASRRASVWPALSAIFPHAVPATDVIETGFSGLNMMIHFPLVLLNVAWMDRLTAGGATAPLYSEGMTEHVERLAEAQDAERARVCAAWNVPFRSLRDDLARFYDAPGASLAEIVAHAEYYRRLPPYPADVWRRWIGTDVAFGHRPLMDFARLAGVDTPIHAANVALAGALLGRDFQREGLNLDRLGLAGKTLAAIKGVVETGA